MSVSSVSRGVTLFDAGRYWDAHEAWEEEWRASTGPEKSTLQALILWSAALHQHQKGIAAGARTLMQRAIERLDGVTVGTRGFEPDQLRDALVDCWSQLEKGNVVQVVQLKKLRVENPEPHVQLEHGLACPYCGEPVMVSVEAQLANNGAHYVEDCPVCCQPWDVRVSGGDPVKVELLRGDD